MAHFRRRKNGNWLITVESGTNPITGERQRKFKTVSRDKNSKEVEAIMAEMILDLQYGTYIDPSKMTLAEFLLIWLKDECEPNLAPRSYQSYERIVKKHLIPAIGKIPLQKFEPIHVQTYQTKKLKKGRHDGKSGGLSNNTVRKHRQILSQALNFGVGLQMLKKNPCEHVKAPKHKRPILNYWDQEEVNKAIKAAKGKWIHDFLFLDLHTGMRRSELLGLKRENVNLTNGNIYVMTILQRIRRKGLILKEYPKTSKSRRNIDISKQVVAVLKRHIEKQEQLKKENKEFNKNNKHNLVFCENDGSMCNPGTVTRRFNYIRDSIDVKKIRLHDVRHTHATLLLKAGVHPKVVQERLGHESITTTMDTYSHVMPSMQKEAAAKMDSLINIDFEDD